jgi:hypothetical protein
MGKFIGAFVKNRFNNKNKIIGVNCPLLIIHGK